MSVTISEVLELLAGRQSLTDEQADFMFAELMDGHMTEAQTGAFFMGLRAKGEDSTDLAAGRSEERRVGKECRIGGKSRWSPYH